MKFEKIIVSFSPLNDLPNPQVNCDAQIMNWLVFDGG